MEKFKVSSLTNSLSLAGAIAQCMRKNNYKCIRIQAIGAGAVNQAVKAVAIARGFVAPNGIDLICIPAFQDIEIENEERTAMNLIIESRLKND